MLRTADDARFWNRGARKYAASPIADPAGYERTLVRTRHYLRPEDVVLEFGCGTGTTALSLAPYAGRIVATDLSREMIQIAVEKATSQGCTNVAFSVERLEENVWPDESFDVVLGFNVLHLIAGRQAALNKVYRLLRGGGHFVSKTPCLGEMNSLLRAVIPAMQLLGKAPYVASFAADDLERELVAAGFEILERGRHGSRRKDPVIFIISRKP